MLSRPSYAMRRLLVHPSLRYVESPRSLFARSSSAVAFYGSATMIRDQQSKHGPQEHADPEQVAISRRIDEKAKAKHTFDPTKPRPNPDNEQVERDRPLSGLNEGGDSAKKDPLEALNKQATAEEKEQEQTELDQKYDKSFRQDASIDQRGSWSKE